MTYYVAGLPYSANDIYHHGIKGQRWGIRRFQNPDGSLTPEGQRRYGTVENFNRQYKGAKGLSGSNNPSGSSGKSKLKTALKVGAVVAGTALVAYGGYKLSKAIGKSDFSGTSKQGQNVINEMFKNNLNDLGSGIKSSTSSAKGAENTLRRMSEQLKSSAPKPSPSRSSFTSPKPSSSSRQSSYAYSFNNNPFNAKDALNRQFERMNDHSDSRNARNAMSELERLNRELKRNRR